MLHRPFLLAPLHLATLGSARAFSSGSLPDLMTFVGSSTTAGVGGSCHASVHPVLAAGFFAGRGVGWLRDWARPILVLGPQRAPTIRSERCVGVKRVLGRRSPRPLAPSYTRATLSGGITTIPTRSGTTPWRAWSLTCFC